MTIIPTEKSNLYDKENRGGSKHQVIVVPFSGDQMPTLIEPVFCVLLGSSCIEQKYV